MDTYIEQLVKRVPDKTTFRKKLIIICLVFFTWFLCVAGFLFRIPIISQLYILIMLGFYFLANRALKNLNIEYEYTITNGDMDVDAVIAQSNRRRLCSFTLSNIEKIGKYIISEHEHMTYGAKVIACADKTDAENTYFCTFHSKKSGNVLLVFTPNDEILAEIKSKLKRQVLRECFSAE